MINLKTTLFLAILMGIFLFIGSFFGEGGVTIAFILAGIMNLFSYFYSDKIVLSMYRARIVSAEEEPFLHEIVEKLSKSAKIPKPKIAVVDTAVPNAFATGRSPKHGVVAVTSGIISMLTKDELEGVIAHEISHIKHRDTLINTISATIAGAITYLGYMLRFAAMSRTNRKNKGGALLLSIFVPISATIIRLAISRNAEYKADERGAKISGKPKALASALLKIESSVKFNPLRGNSYTSHLFIINPFKAENILSLFSTHPLTSERVKKLNELTSF